MGGKGGCKWKLFRNFSEVSLCVPVEHYLGLSKYNIDMQKTAVT